MIITAAPAKTDKFTADRTPQAADPRVGSGSAVGETVPAGTKRCKECGQTKPLEQFYDASKGTGKRPYCRKCDHRRQYETRARTRARTVRQRAYHRSLAALKDLVPADTWHRVYAAELVKAEAEVDQVGDVILMPGQRMDGETAADRIATLCADCGDHHRRGHACPVCGSTPGQPAAVIQISALASGQARVSAKQITVLKP
ncbi:hypothetical protein [Microlunatus ginsengisoli]